MKVLPITVLFSEGPIARAYLALLKRRGYLVDQIVELLPRARGIGRLVPTSARQRFLGYSSSQKMHHWPKRLPVLYPETSANMTRAVAAHYDLGDGFFDEISGLEPLSSYSDIVTRIEVSGLADEAVLKALSNLPHSVALFTGGGLVRSHLTTLEGLKLLHIHPGYLPHVRGADGLLWSMLLRGRPGASAFFMASGIDEGDLLAASEFEPLKFSVGPGELPDTQNMYRMLFSYYDPVIRAALLCDLVAATPDLPAMVGERQDLETGRTFHFMGRRMRIEALSTVFEHP
jgi:hypothetical protein